MYCESCEVTWELASIRCPDCRARLVEPPLPESEIEPEEELEPVKEPAPRRKKGKSSRGKNKTAVDKNIPKYISQSRLRDAPDLSDLYIAPNIPSKKWANVYAHYQIRDDELLLLLDCTVFGSAKVGTAIGTRGIYWRTDWTTSTMRNALTWREFVKRDITLDGSTISLGEGDNMDLATVTGTNARVEFVEFLKRLQKRLK